MPTVTEVVNNHQGSIFFYPFSGLDFKLMNDIVISEYIRNNFNPPYLFIYCSISSERDWNNLPDDQQNGKFISVNFVQNKLEESGRNIIKTVRLDPQNANINLYQLNDGVSIVFVKDNVYTFLNNLEERLNQNKSINVIFYFCGDITKDGIQNLISQFIVNDEHFIGANHPVPSNYFITRYYNFMDYLPDGLYNIVMDNEGNKITLDDLGIFLIKRNS